MALWQFTLDLIPAEAAQIEGVPAIRLTREQLDNITLELTSADGQKLFGWLSAILPEKQSWHKDLRIWGDEKDEDAQVSFDAERIEYVQFRLHAGDRSLALIRGICAIAQNLGCAFATRKGAVIQPKAEAVVRAMLQSPAARFVNDPKAYLEAAVLMDMGSD